MIGEITTKSLVVVLNKIDMIPPDLREKKIAKTKAALTKVFAKTKFKDPKVRGLASLRSGAVRSGAVSVRPWCWLQSLMVASGLTSALRRGAFLAHAQMVAISARPGGPESADDAIGVDELIDTLKVGRSRDFPVCAAPCPPALGYTSGQCQTTHLTTTADAVAAHHSFAAYAVLLKAYHHHHHHHFLCFSKLTTITTTTFCALPGLFGLSPPPHQKNTKKNHPSASPLSM